MEHEYLFPKPLAEVPIGWEICTQQEAIAIGTPVRAWVSRNHTFHRADRSTSGRIVQTKRPEYIRPVKSNT